MTGGEWGQGREGKANVDGFGPSHFTGCLWVHGPQVAGRLCPRSRVHISLGSPLLCCRSGGCNRRKNPQKEIWSYPHAFCFLPWGTSGPKVRACHPAPTQTGNTKCGCTTSMKAKQRDGKSTSHRNKFIKPWMKKLARSFLKQLP